MNNKIWLYLVLLAFPLALPAQSYTVDQVPYDNLQNKYDFVSNPDGIISLEAEQQLNSMIIGVKDSVSAEIAVVLLKSIGDADMDDFATALFTKWGIGKRAKDNGLLFLLVEDQRQMLFRTGYGLEGILPDAILARIIRNDISPLMAQGHPDQAMLVGIGTVCQYLLNPDTVQEILAQENERDDERLSIGDIVVVAIFLIIFFIIIARSKKYDNKDSNDSFPGMGNKRSGGYGGFTGWSGGGGSMGGGFGGGRTGGGGARGGW